MLVAAKMEDDVGNYHNGVSDSPTEESEEILLPVVGSGGDADLAAVTFALNRANAAHEVHHLPPTRMASSFMPPATPLVRHRCVVDKDTGRPFPPRGRCLANSLKVISGSSSKFKFIQNSAKIGKSMRSNVLPLPVTGGNSAVILKFLRR